MGKASSAKKVARAARAGGTRRAGQRRQLGFPVAVGLVLAFGLLLVFIARERRNADAFPRANQDHVHASIDIYTCVTAEESAAASTTTTAPTTTTTVPPSTSSGETTTTSAPTTTTTAPTTSTTQLASTDVHGEYQPAPTDASQDTLGIHTHGDGLMHIHPFKDSVAGRNATLSVFLDQVGISMTNDTLTLGTGQSFKEGTTKCADGKDGVLQVAKWDHANEAAAGNKPNQIFTSGFDKVRLGANQSFVIAFMPEGSTIKAKSDVQDRISKVSDLQPSTTAPTGSNSTGSAPPTSIQVTPGSSDQSSSTSGATGSTATSAPSAPSSSAASGP